MSFDSLGLAPELLRAVSELGYRKPTPIQSEAIPVILPGRDVMAGAQTGTGKTAGFTLPLLQRLHLQPARSQSVRALVLVPTRELAAQVGQSIADYGQHLPLRCIEIFGGVNINRQTKALRRGVEIVVATPGRLIDHANQGNIDLKGIEILVLDEADRMLDMGFIPDIRRILKLLPAREQRQNLLFSATTSKAIQKLARDLLDHPALIEVSPPNATADKVDQAVYRLPRPRKRALLSYLIGSQRWQQVLVFTRTKHGANRLAKQLNSDGLTASPIHGNKSQAARTKALAGFKTGDIRVLVATDIAARGLDIDQLPHVVNFDLPNVPEDYVHRIGRTARAGHSGQAVSLVDDEETKHLKAIERLIGRKIKTLVVPDLPPPQARPQPPAGRSQDEPDSKPKPKSRRRKRSNRGAAASPQKPGSEAPANRRRRRRKPKPKPAHTAKS